jgi:plasmid stabilization system protein ParE
MSLVVQRAEYFSHDFYLQTGWYLDKGGVELAYRFDEAVEATLLRLAQRPDIGRVRKFRHPKLRNLRSFSVNAPFEVVLIFYRIEGDVLHADRLMPGSRHLSRRLVQPPGSE